MWKTLRIDEILHTHTMQKERNVSSLPEDILSLECLERCFSVNIILVVLGNSQIRTGLSLC